MNYTNYKWWDVKESETCLSVFSYVKSLDTEQGYRQSDNFKNMRLYGNYDLYNLRSYQYLKSENANSIQNRVTLNVIQSMIDTVVSKISKNKPKPMFLTENGDFSLKRKAILLTQFAEGIFQSCDFYEKSAMAFQDSCVFGTGAIKIFRVGNEIKAERVFIDEIIVDDREAFYGAPRQMHQRKYIHKDVLKEMFPKNKLSIDRAASLATGNISESPTGKNTDMILVIESWHLPSGPKAKDGRHTICIEECTLHAEEYERSYFPFVFWRWGLRSLGFFGQGLSEQLSGLQLEINKILRTIQVSMHLCSVPKIFIEASSKIVDAHLDNKIGSVIKYAGQPPVPGQLGLIPAELFTQLDRLYSRAYEIAGVSQLSATAQKPAGLDSGKALRTYNDLETERFMSVGIRYEKAFMDAVPMFIDLAKEIDELPESEFKVKVRGKKFLKTIKWKDVSMDDDLYTMAVFPTSALSSTPAGRLQDVQELIQAGFLGKEDAMKLLDFPDLQNFYNFENAPGEDIDMVIEEIIEHGRYTTPEPYQNLAYGIQKMQKAYLRFKTDKAPESKLELFRRWIEDANALINKAAVEAERQQMQSQMGTEQVAMDQAAAQMPPAEEPIPNEEDMGQPLPVT